MATTMLKRRYLGEGKASGLCVRDRALVEVVVRLLWSIGALVEVVVEVVVEVGRGRLGRWWRLRWRSW